MSHTMTPSPLERQYQRLLARVQSAATRWHLALTTDEAAALVRACMDTICAESSRWPALLVARATKLAADYVENHR